MGHTCRKLKKYEEALEFHQQARVLDPHSPSTYSAIGYVYTLRGDSLQAIDYFHKALAIRRDDAFSTTMLSNLIESYMNEVSPGNDMDDLPSFAPPEPMDPPVFSLDDPMETKDLPAMPIMRLTSKLDESVNTDISLADSSALAIEEVEMGDCD